MYKYKRFSRFLKWIIIYGAIFTLLLLIYILLDRFGLVAKYRYKVRHSIDHWQILNIFLIFLIAIIYGFFSLFNLLSHESVEDGRMNCLSIILSVFFLVLENALVHASDNGNFYEITMGVFSAAVVGVITFASLKFSFELSTKQKLLSEISSVKPDINIQKVKTKYIANIQRNNCYLCGVYIGKIDKILYVDIKRSGNEFEMENLYLPNKRTFYEKDKKKAINLKDLSPSAPDINEIYKKDYTYLIFCDTQNYYYFVKLPSKNDEYKIIGINEYVVSRLVHKFNCVRYNNKSKNIKYEAMDVFNTTFNFYPEYKSKL